MSLDPHPEFVPWRADFGSAGLLRMSHPTLQRDRQGFDYGEQQNVQKLHAAVRREKRGGRVTVKPFSLWMLVIWGIVFFFAGFFRSATAPTSPPRTWIGATRRQPSRLCKLFKRALLLPAPSSAPSQTPTRH